ncbi:MAG TPA: GTP cyclohydrolase II [Marinagarivorans sp.]|nr:GTP cyclohydrolase II [Cellvibrionaceae bacterium]HMY40608.1 GTP cyclohydrolase II [Marinagarivorans sp.]HNG60256.1 GTP cyclohydrolase II [Cellvibrionaceae bacterium]
MNSMLPTQITRLACARIPTRHGDFLLYYYGNSIDTKEHLAFCFGDVSEAEAVLVRVHSECFTGDVLGSLRCDCGEQLDRALAAIAAAGRGVVVYLRQEGRGIGLLEKLRAYNLQDAGFDTLEANIMLGHGADEREYSLAAHILADLSVRSVRLLTNNPAKIRALIDAGVTIIDRVALEISANPENIAYLATKAKRMEHLLNDLSVELTP